MDYSMMPGIPILGNNLPFLLLAITWTLIWKGLALWKAAGLKQKGWFIAFFIINTFGILEIIYLFIITRKHKVE